MDLRVGTIIEAEKILDSKSGRPEQRNARALAVFGLSIIRVRKHEDKMMKFLYESAYNRKENKRAVPP